MKTFDDFIKDANSILNTLDKDYEAMQSQKSDVRQSQTDKFDDLCKDMNSIILKYSKTISDFRNRIDHMSDADGDTLVVYDYPGKDRVLVMIPQLYWTGEGKPTFYIRLYERPKEGSGNYSSATLSVSETGIEKYSSGFTSDRYSDAVSVFLNRRPTYEQLDTAFQTALTNFIKYCVTCIQKRNENLADHIKSITE